MESNFFIVQMATLLVYALIYQMVYRRNAGFKLNRIFLLFTLVLGVFIPLITFDVFPYLVTESTINFSERSIGNTFEQLQKFDYLKVVYFAGIVLSALLFLLKLVSTIVFLAKTKFVKEDGLYINTNSQHAFSFFNYIMVQKENKIQLAHEQAHAALGHSFDRLLVELVLIGCWWNPLVYVYKYLIIENHEFAADQEAVTSLKMEKEEYVSKIINHISKNQMINLRNNYYSLIKNRIIMLSKSKNQHWKYSLMFPMLMLVFSAFTFKKYPVVSQSPKVIAISQDTTPMDTKSQVVQHRIQPSKVTIQEQNNIELEKNFQIDTIITYDPVTFKETMQVVKNNYIDAEKYMSSKILSGKNVEVIDTIVVFDPNTYEETVTIKKIKIPYELSFIIDQTDPRIREKIVKKYGIIEEKQIQSK